MDRDTHLQRLGHAVASGRLVTVVGSGVSIAASRNLLVEGCAVAGWQGLLQHGVKHCLQAGLVDEEDVELLNLQTKSKKTEFLIAAAEDISRRLRGAAPGVFRGWLKDTIGKLAVRDASLLEALVQLPGLLATLNYDTLLEQQSGRRPISWQQTDRVQDALREGASDVVLHLHGWFEEPDSVVFGSSSYRIVKDHAHAKAVLQLFTLDRTLLFVGCGDTVVDPNFSELIAWAREALSDVSPRHYLLCRAEEVTGVQKKLGNAPWIQVLDYGENFAALGPFLAALAQRNPRLQPSSPRAVQDVSFDLEAYQQAMRKRYGRLKLEELDPTTHDVEPLTLTGMFIAQSARECTEFMPRVYELPKEARVRLREAGEFDGDELEEPLVAERRRAYLARQPRPILDILSDTALPRVVVLGDPGSGKSTLLQYALLSWAEQSASEARGPLPLLIELREYARLREAGRIDDFLGYLHSGASVRWHLAEQQLDAWLLQNASLVLFDGLDEVFDPTLRNEVSIAIHRFGDRYPKARVVVTSRIIGYQHQLWRDEGFSHFMLQELDDAQIADFLRRWHERAYDIPARGEEKRALLAQAIEESGAIRQLAGNPLLVTMMAILNRTQDLPRDRAELYEQCARLLLHQWKVELAFATDPELAKASLDFRDKRSLLLRVARAMQTSEQGLAGNLIAERDLERTLAEGLRGVPNIRADRAARALIEQLRGRNFMLSAVGARSHAFVHRTFLEYFCAVDTSERFQTEQTLSLEDLKTKIFSHFADDSWQEVLSLLAGMLAPRFVAEICESLLGTPDRECDGRAVLLAARCIGEVRKRSELGPVERAVFARAQGLLSYDLDYWFNEYTDEELRVQAVRRRAIRTTARTWRGDPEVGSWLKRIALSREPDELRCSALDELARGWGAQPEVVTVTS
jgi:hypothetical protein